MATPMHAPIAPARTHTQRLDALTRANQVRMHRARVKNLLRAGVLSGPEVLQAPQPQLATMRVYDLLISLPKIGRVKATRILNHLRISQSKTIGGLSDRQRVELVAFLEA